MRHTEAMQSPLAEEGKVAQLEGFIKGLTFQLAYLEQANSNYNFQLTELQGKLSEMELVLSEKDHNIDSLKMELQACRRK